MTNTSQIQDEISNIFREIENDIGATELTIFVLNKLAVAVDNFKISDKKDFFDQLTNLLFSIKNTKPRIAIIIAHFSKIYDDFVELFEKTSSIQDLIAGVKKSIQEAVEEIKKEDVMVEEFGVSCIEPKDVILIHSHSKRVLNIIAKGAKTYPDIKVIVAEQDPQKTKDMVDFLYANKVNFVTVPEYMLSYVEDEISKVFLGGLTLNSEFSFVADSGTAAVVSEFKDAGKPVYMFISSQKFSLWKSDSKMQNTHKITQEIGVDGKSGERFSYERIKYVYDRVGIDNFYKVVTEKGVFSPDEVKKIYKEKYAKYKEWRKRHFEKCEEEECV